jgi:hypothetical protein
MSLVGMSYSGQSRATMSAIVRAGAAAAPPSSLSAAAAAASAASGAVLGKRSLFDVKGMADGLTAASSEVGDASSESDDVQELQKAPKRVHATEDNGSGEDDDDFHGPEPQVAIRRELDATKAMIISAPFPCVTDQKYATNLLHPAQSHVIAKARSNNSTILSEFAWIVDSADARGYATQILLLPPEHVPSLFRPTVTETELKAARAAGQSLDAFFKFEDAKRTEMLVNAASTPFAKELNKDPLLVSTTNRMATADEYVTMMQIGYYLRELLKLQGCIVLEDPFPEFLVPNSAQTAVLGAVRTYVPHLRLRFVQPAYKAVNGIPQVHGATAVPYPQNAEPMLRSLRAHFAAMLRNALNNTRTMYELAAIQPRFYDVYEEPKPKPTVSAGVSNAAAAAAAAGRGAGWARPPPPGSFATNTGGGGVRPSAAAAAAAAAAGR